MSRIRLILPALLLAALGVAAFAQKEQEDPKPIPPRPANQPAPKPLPPPGTPTPPPKLGQIFNQAKPAPKSNHGKCVGVSAVLMGNKINVYRAWEDGTVELCRNHATLWIEVGPAKK